MATLTPEEFDNSVPLIFVFLGDELPAFSRSALRLALRTSGFKRIMLLGDSDRPRGIPPTISYHKIQDFYDPREFSEFERKTILPTTFRDGFWLKTAERLFVLYQFCYLQKINDFSHAELDVLLLNPQPLINQIRALELDGVFAPRETIDRTMASFLYCNSLPALREILDFILDNAELGNEMDILGAFSNKTNNTSLFALPTVDALFRNTDQQNPPWNLPTQSLPALVDGAVLGRWLFGVDPRNTKGKGTRNLVKNPPFTVPIDLPLEKLQFRFELSSWTLLARNAEGWYRVVAIHVHSKIHKLLSGPLIWSVVYRANRGVPTRLVCPSHKPTVAVAQRIAKDFFLFLRQKEFRNAQLKRIKTRLTFLVSSKRDEEVG